MATYTCTLPSSFTIGAYLVGITIPSNEYISNISISFSKLAQHINFTATESYYQFNLINPALTKQILFYSNNFGESSEAQHGIRYEYNKSSSNAVSLENSISGSSLYFYIVGKKKVNGSWYSTQADEFVFDIENCIITITTSLLSYNVTIGQSSGGVATFNKTNPVQTGTTVTLTATPNTGYQHSGWSSSPSVTITNNQFTMPSNNVTITPIFTKSKYVLTINSSPYGTATASKASPVEYEATVTLFVQPNSGYEFSGWSSSPSITITNNQFLMPSSDVTITPLFAKKSYILTINASSDGTVIANVSNPVLYDTTVTLTVQPNNGYELLTWYSNPSISINVNNQFSMPSYNVSIMPIFKKTTSIAHSGRYNGSTWDMVTPMYYNGSEWVECELQRYNGTSWDNVDTR